MSELTIGGARELDGEIGVLLVDDNEEWADLVATRIEREADEIDVTVAVSANEAMIALQQRDDIDCLVVDYMMPRTDGLQLLERVREEYPRLPYLLVTSEGNEAVAARAIEADVTDYLVKDPSGDQTVRFVEKITAAVERYRLRQAIEESEKRYRTVTEQSRDAIGIFQGGDVLFSNGRLAEITGRDQNDLYEDDFVEQSIHPGDRDSVRDVIDDAHSGANLQALREARIVQQDGTVRHCEYTGQWITLDDERVAVVSIRDVTGRHRRERKLRWERELNRTVQEALVESRAREHLESEIAVQLRRHGYALAWIAEEIGDALVPRVIEGQDEYVEAVEWSLGGDGSDTEPMLRAGRTGDPQFNQDFTDLFRTEWRDAADATGFRSGAAIPLEYNEVTYGLLGVYHDQSDHFDETERRLLTELAETMAFAIHSIETEQALATDRGLTATVQIADGSYYLTALAREAALADADHVHVQGTIPHEGELSIQYVTIEGGDLATVRETLSSHAAVTDITVIEGADPIRVQVIVAGSVPEAHLASQGIAVHSTSIDTDGATIEVELPGRDVLRSTVDALDDRYDTVSVLSVTETDHGSDATAGTNPGIADLTEKQAQALQAAYYHGYFARPRGNTATTIAESLGITHSTFLQHLHRAQEKVFASHFD